MLNEAGGPTLGVEVVVFIFWDLVYDCFDVQEYDLFWQ